MENAGKNNRAILAIIIIVILAVIVFWGTGKKVKPVDFDTDPFADNTQQPIPVEINHRQQDLDSVTKPVASEIDASASVIEENVILPEEGMNPDMPIVEEKQVNAQEESAETAYYIVKKGDNLSKIALRQLGSAKKWKEIFKINKTLLHNNPAGLKIGMKLTLPSDISVKDVAKIRLESIKVKKTSNDIKKQNPTTISYKVKKGDSLYKIAQKLYGKGSAWKQILNANKSLVGSNGQKLATGQLLVIPAIANKTEQVDEPSLIIKDGYKHLAKDNKGQFKPVDSNEIDENIFNFETKVQIP